MRRWTVDVAPDAAQSRATGVVLVVLGALAGVALAVWWLLR